MQVRSNTDYNEYYAGFYITIICNIKNYIYRKRESTFTVSIQRMENKTHSYIILNVYINVSYIKMTKISPRKR